MSAAILHEMPPLEPPEPPLTDGVVALRGIREADADQIVAALQDPDIVRWTRVPADYTHADFDAYRAFSAERMAAGAALNLLVVDAGDHGRVLGSCSLHELDTDHPDVGYWVAPDARGRGVAPRAARLLATYAVEVLGRGRVDVLVHADNAASLRAAEKAGFHRTGEYRPSPRRDETEPQPDLVVLAFRDDAGSGAGAG